MSRPTISHPLKKLREAGLTHRRKEGTMGRHRVDETAYTALSTLMGEPHVPDSRSDLPQGF